VTEHFFSSKKNLGGSNSQNTFWRYSLYAWISPLLMTLAVLLNQFLYRPEDSFKAQIGNNTVCFLYTDYKEKCE